MNIISIIPPSMRLYHRLDKECSARAGILNNNPVRKLGKNTKMPTASSMPRISEKPMIMFIGFTLNFSATFFSNLLGSAKSPYTSAERISMPMPSYSWVMRLTTPRTKGRRKITFLSLGFFTLLVSTVISPASVRTAVAMEVAPFIITPSKTA